MVALALALALALAACGSVTPVERPVPIASPFTSAPLPTNPKAAVVAISHTALFVDEQAVGDLDAPGLSDALDNALARHASFGGASSEAVLVADSAVPYAVVWPVLRALRSHGAVVVHVFVRGGSVDGELGPHPPRSRARDRRAEAPGFDGMPRATVTATGVAYVRDGGGMDADCADVPRKGDALDLKRVRGCAEKIAQASPTVDSITVDGTDDATFGDVTLVIDVMTHRRAGPIVAHVRFGPVSRNRASPVP